MNWDQHVENRNRLPPEKLKPFFGKYVAWSMDGTRVVASGDDDLQVFQAVQSAGLRPEDLVFSYVPFPDEIVLGGAYTLGDGERDE